MDEAHDDAPLLVLVDGSSYLYRAYHAMPDLRAVPGDPASPPTGAIRGMLNMLQALAKTHPTEHLAVVFDAPGPTFREALYPDYKAHRAPMPDDLRAQIEPILEVIGLQGWPVLRVPGVEADDVIGTLARLAAQQGWRVVISSGDKDLSQLVDERITIVDTMSGKVRDAAGVEAEFGVPPRLMLDFQTLVGDAVDNVPGVDKVGPKTAAKWLQAYGSLDGIVAHAHEIKGAAGEHLRRALDWLPKGRELLRIRTDCDLAAHVPGWPSLEALRRRPADTAGLRAFYERYGFRSLARALDEEAGAPDAPAQAALPMQAAPLRCTVVQDRATLQAWVERLRAAPLAALDAETTSLDELQARLVGLSLAVAPGEAAYIPLAHEGPDRPAQLPLEEVLQALRPWLEDAAAPKLGQHVKYDLHVLANHGIAVRGYVHDTLLQSYVLEAHKPHNLDSLAERHLGRKGLTYEQVCGKGAQQIPFAQVPLERAAAYACEDAEMCLAVHGVLWPRLQAEPALQRIYRLEMDVTHVLLRMERHGVLIDAAELRRQSEELGRRIAELEAEAHALAGQPFNLGSPKQIAEVFYGRLGLPVLKKTATGAPSTDEEVLEKLAEDYPLPAKVLQHRSLAKLKSTYTDKLPAMVNPATGRVHTHYAQAVAVTGRLASNEPNLQNIPIRTPEGRRIRRAFIAPPGWRIASADYSQIELRIMAHLSEDAALLKAFAEGQDVHRATAAEVFGLPPEAVSPEQRRYAKTINFGLIYGMSAYGLAKALGIDATAAKNYIERYFERFAGVRAYMERTRAQAKARGWVETVFGRRLFLPEINSPNGPRRSAAERAAINAPMQGTAADLIKMSMVAVQRALDEAGLRTRMILQVHDELVFEVPEDELEWVRREVPRLMAGVATLRVPLVAEVGIGPNWEQAH
ncbi:DNA polymerase I [Tepidimonas alkaliphilus]|uniref:DNA polymerase I n=1 Tax=Tepidimonas alkaliphilus TaxID=2588942 RepID=A0A554WD40_9BURK|nr:DNA polymerase I [Tepidimonas alkaliphilus]TSE21484.1 DNA polymerase I [Tepidimonas alkaliphilus]